MGLAENECSFSLNCIEYSSLSPIIKESVALLQGHFILSSGLHSPVYLQCAKIFSNPKFSEILCKELALICNKKYGKNYFDTIVSPAMGGVIVGYELARQLNCLSIFFERVNAKFELRRGFSIHQNAKVILVEDVVTTGKSVLEVITELENSYHVKIEAIACIINRGKNDYLAYQDSKIPIISLGKLEIKTYHDNNIPDWLKTIPVSTPGSRFMNAKKHISFL